MTRIQGVRERARGEITAAIKDEARRQLASLGAAKLSLRAVARELGMVSSALYRYFPNRDDLLTALITDAYDALGAEAEAALDRSTAQGATPFVRWQAVCRSVRAWALAHPHEYALVYGSPVPGYAAPDSTTGPAARVALALIAVAADAHAEGTLRVPGTEHAVTGEAPASVIEDASGLARQLGIDLPAPVLAEMAAAWAQLYGLISFELFGQFERVIDARDAFFEHATAGLARNVGLV